MEKLGIDANTLLINVDITIHYTSLYDEEYIVWQGSNCYQYISIKQRHKADAKRVAIEVIFKRKAIVR